MPVGKRRHLFEFEDQTWFPSLFRRLITDVLCYQITHFKTYKPMLPKLKKIMEIQKQNEIIDLCSGSGGPMLQIQKLMESEEDMAVKITLTDKFPNDRIVKELNKFSDGKAEYIANSIDATAVPQELQGIRTMFTAFHHFKPNDALQVLQDAVNKKAGIGIFEFTERSRFMLLKSIFPFIAVLISTAFIRPFTFSRFFFTYIIPVVPFAFFWDALVSNYRTYTPEELRGLVNKLSNNEYHWEIGKEVAEKPIWNITYLIGYPQQKTQEV